MGKNITKDKNKTLAVNLIYGFSAIMGVFFSVLTVVTSILIPSFIDSKIIFGVGVVLMLITIGLVYLKKYSVAKYLIIIVPPYILLIVSLVFKSQGVLSNVFTYLIPRVFCVLYLMAPIIFFGIKQYKRMIISFIFLSPTIFLFDFLHHLIGVNIETLSYDPKFYFGFLVLFISIYSLPLISLLFSQKANILFKKKIKKQNAEIKQETESTQALNTKLVFQANLYTILDIIFQNIPLNETFDKVLETLFEIETINIEKKGLIFLKNEEGNLKLKAHKNVGVLKKMCATVSPGQCLCGKALLQKETLFCNSVTHDHTTRPEEMQPHGHYIIPIKYEEIVLGVLCLYIKEGTEKDDDALNYLETVTSILANKIIKENQKNKLEIATIRLQKSEANFNQISNTIDDAFYLYNIVEKKYEYISLNCEQVLGVNQKLFYSGENIKKLVLHKDDETIFKEATLKVNNGEFYDIEYRIIVNGVIRWIREQSFPIKDSAGKTIKNSGICSDITVKKGSEHKIKTLLEDLTLKEDTLLKITESQHLVFWLSTWDTNNLDYISPSYERLFERPVESIINNSSSWYDNIHPEDKERVRQTYIEEVPKGTYDIEFRLLFKDGRIKWVRERAFPVEQIDGVFGKVSGISEDVTNQKLLEEELRKSHEETRNLAKIGVGLTELLSTVEIIEYVYQKVAQLMDVSSFAIGLVDKKNKKLIYPLVIEDDKNYEDVIYSLDENTLATICIGKNQEIVISDIENDFQKYSDEPLDLTVGNNPISVIYLPLKFKGKIIGVVTVQSLKKSAYSENQINLLRNLSVSVANVITNAQLNETLEERINEKTKEVVLQSKTIEKSYENRELLSQIGLDISATLKFEEIFDKLHQNVSKLLDAEIFGVRIYNQAENIIEYKYGIESGVRNKLFEVPFSDKDNYTVWCIENKKEIFINDNKKEYKKYVNEIRVPGGEMPNSLIFHPMIIGEAVLGAITVQSFTKNAYSKEDLNILKTLSFYTAIALANAQLYESLEFKVVARTLELSRKNKEITDSINYAKRIQDAMKTGEEDRKKYLPDSFVVYEPKDILSGDFYRIDKIETTGEELIFCTVGDCTGHGIPGATLAILCSSLLSAATTQLEVNSPGEALDYTRRELEAFFSNSDQKTIDDGMDVAFCVLDEKNKTLHFAGANSNCIILRGEELIVLKGDRKHVGYSEDEFFFTTHKFELQKNDCIYLSSDGIIDQFGGPDNRKFMRKRFLEVVESKKNEPMVFQGQNIKEQFENWKGETEQTDDVCVIGIRIT